MTRYVYQLEGLKKVLEGEYGARDIYLGVPVQLGAGGMERIFEVELAAPEKAMLANSIRLCSESIGEARHLLATAFKRELVPS